MTLRSTIPMCRVNHRTFNARNGQCFVAVSDASVTGNHNIFVEQRYHVNTHCFALWILPQNIHSVNQVTILAKYLAIQFLYVFAFTPKI